jgi:cysteine desulfurase
MDPVYLDNAATTPLSPEVRVAMEPWLTEEWGNPSSPHRMGVRAREAIDRARAQVARAIGARPEGVIFTSGGSEANNLALRGQCRPAARDHGCLIVGPTEHASVRSVAEALAEEGIAVEHGKLDSNGALDLEQLSSRLDEDTFLVAQMLVSNEFGNIYPIAELSRSIASRAPEARLHVDAVQAVGKIEVSMTSLGADSVSLSAHKIHGPKGVGALVVRGDLPLRPTIFGGGQENGYRSGTENVAGIVGFGCAIERANRSQADTLANLTALRAGLIEKLEGLEGIELLLPGGPSAPVQPGIVSLLVSGAPAEVWLHHLDARGVTVGTGSACQARKQEISPVLLAAGLSERRARSVLRLSFSQANTLPEIDRALFVLREVSGELSKLK